MFNRITNALGWLFAAVVTLYVFGAIYAMAAADYARTVGAS